MDLRFKLTLQTTSKLGSVMWYVQNYAIIKMQQILFMAAAAACAIFEPIEASSFL